MVFGTPSPWLHRHNHLALGQRYRVSTKGSCYFCSAFVVVHLIFPFYIKWVNTSYHHQRPCRAPASEPESKHVFHLVTLQQVWMYPETLETSCYHLKYVNIKQASWVCCYKCSDFQVREKVQQTRRQPWLNKHNSQIHKTWHKWIAKTLTANFDEPETICKYCSFTAGLKRKSTQLWKETQGKHKSRRWRDNTGNTRKHTQNTLIKTFKYKGATEISHNFSDHT